MSSPTPPAAISYTSRDFASLLSDSLALAGVVLPDWQGAKTGEPSDFGVVLLELLAYQSDILSYYNDRVANEAYLTTATQRTSVLSHARAIGYTPNTAVAASVDLTLAVTTSVPTTIPAGFQVATVALPGQSALVFETQNDVTFPAGVGTPLIPQYLDVQALEGVTILDEVVGVSSGGLDQRFGLRQTPVISTSVQVRVIEDPLTGGDVWFPTNALLNVESTDNAYAWSLDGNDALTIIFGDGVNGRVPPRGSVIHATYRVGGGADGNVIAGSINVIVDPTDVVFPTADPNHPTPISATTTIPAISVINKAASGGGANSESLDSIRVNAPKSLRTLDRAVSLSDYETLATGIPQVHIAKAKAVGAVFTNITLYVAASNGSQVTQDVLNAVVSYFGPRKMAGVTVVAATPTYSKIDIGVTVVIDPRYNQDAVSQSVNASVLALMAFDNVSFGQRVAIGDVYTAALSHPGVTNVVVSKIARSGGTGATDIVLAPNEIPVVGVVTVTAQGGVVNSAVYSPNSGGSITPTATNAPTISLLRGDTNSVHVELAWTGGANITMTDVQIDYLNLGVSVLSTVVGTYTGTSAIFDLPFVGVGTASQIRFIVRAFNGAVGPVSSVGTTTPYTFG